MIIEVKGINNMGPITIYTGCIITLHLDKDNTLVGIEIDKDKLRTYGVDIVDFVKTEGCNCSKGLTQCVTEKVIQEVMVEFICQYGEEGRHFVIEKAYLPYSSMKDIDKHIDKLKSDAQDAQLEIPEDLDSMNLSERAELCKLYVPFSTHAGSPSCLYCVIMEDCHLEK